jgi:hypothetical protein
MTKKLKIFLTGGLGNQLFQLAAGLHYANDRNIELDLETANPRRNSKGEVELLSLHLPSDILLQEENEGRLVRKIFGFNLRSGYLPKKYERCSVFRLIRRILSSITLMLLLGERFTITVSGDLGNDPKIQASKFNQILVGYFQTFRVAQGILEIKELLFTHLHDEKFIEYRNRAREEVPLLVHVRLGDYQNEDQFGILSSNYYESAISAQWDRGIYKKIWLFSDQPQDGMKRIPEKYREFTRVISSEGLESAETLGIMTMCRGFIIANSSFSWWAAYLRENQADHVIAPQPWFLSLQEPSELVPKQWTRLPGFF